MKLLFLHCTDSIDKEMIALALAKGHEVTCFAPETSKPMIEGAEILPASWKSEPEIKNIAGRRWDALIDVSSDIFSHDDVREYAKMFVKHVSKYVFLSTLNVSYWYRDGDLGKSLGKPSQMFTSEQYANKKAQCEYELGLLFGNKLAVSRPGLLVGWDEDPARLTYWVNRVRSGGEVLAPGRPNRPIHFIDRDDLAQFMLTLGENSASGAFDAIGPELPTTMREILETCRNVTKSAATFTWVSDSFLERSQVSPEMLSLWTPQQTTEEHSDFADRPKSPPVPGLILRPLAQTIQKILDHNESILARFSEPSTLSAIREAEILRRWHQLSHPYQA